MNVTSFPLQKLLNILKINFLTVQNVSLTNACILFINLLLWKTVRIVKMKAQTQIVNENVNELPVYPIC